MGTGIDPLTYIEQHGADVTRFAVVWQATGQDIRWDETAVIGGKKFLNKLWNASKFVMHNQSETDITTQNIEGITEADKKILKEVRELKDAVAHSIEIFEFSKALHDMYEFFWHSFCDEYIEIAKTQLQNEAQKSETQRILQYVLRESLIMLHPFIPFITETIWKTIPHTESLLLVQSW